MMKELIEYVATCPLVRDLKRGVTANFSGASDLTVTEEPAMQPLFRYHDGSTLLSRRFRIELHVSHAGDTDKACADHALFSGLMQHVCSAPYPEIPEGDIVSIIPVRGGNQSKTGIFEGIMAFKIIINYKTRGDFSC